MALKLYLLFVIIVLFVCCNFVFCGIGDRSRAECRRRGESMVECQRILYGSKSRIPADLLQFPHMVLIGYNVNNNTDIEWNCGGSLISPFWVLTAAHCLDDVRTGPANHLLVGTTSFEHEEAEDLEQRRNVFRRIPHPGYKPPLKYNDVGLLLANKRFQLNRDVRIACLHLPSDIAYDKAIATGFGKTEFDESDGSDTLMQVELNLVPQDKCNASMKSMTRNGMTLKNGIIESQLCAGDLDNGGKDTCQGDSGGPLQVLPENPDCKTTFPLYVVLGVTSFGRFCGFKKSPGVYSRVSYYVDWIESVVWPNSDEHYKNIKAHMPNIHISLLGKSP